MDKRLYTIVSNIASGKSAAAVSTIQNVLEDRIGVAIRNFTAKHRISPNGSQ